MKQTVGEIQARHQALSPLLPWYVNKTLQAAELQAVEAHLQECLACKREFMQLQKLAHAVAQEGLLDTAESASFSRLKKRLHAGAKTGHAGDSGSAPAKTLPQQPVTAGANVIAIPTAKLPNWLSPAMYQPALAIAAVLLLAVFAPRYFEISLKPSNDFRTLSSDKVVPASVANEIRVVFVDGLGQQQKDGIVGRINGQIVNQPTEQGVYTVQLGGDIDHNRLLEAVQTLRKDSGVIFAEPAYALLSAIHKEEKQ